MIFDRKQNACVKELPEGYAESFVIDMQRNKKELLIVNGAAIAVFALLFFIGNLIVPIRGVFSGEIFSLLLKVGVMIAAYIAYIILHELVHGLFMRFYGSTTVKYGFTGIYAFAASSEYYGRDPYIVITLAPVVIWGVVLAVICALVPPSWFWVVYFILAGNFSGAAGDAYVTFRLARSRKTLLITDSGTAMKAYDKTEE